MIKKLGRNCNLRLFGEDMRGRFSDNKMKAEKKYLFGFIAGGILFWFFDASTHALFFSKTKSFFDLLALDIGAHEIYVRLIVLTLFATLGVILSRAEAKKRKYAGDIDQSRKFYKAVLNSIGDAVIAADAKGFVTGMNPVAEKLTGWSEKEAIGKKTHTVFRIVNEITRKEVENPVDKVIKTGLVVNLANHTALIARDGTERSIADSGAPINSHNGEIVGVVLVFRDVTDERKSENLLKFNERKFRSYIFNTSDGISLTDSDGKIIEWNPAMESLTGIAREKALGRFNWEVQFDTLEKSRRTPETLEKLREITLAGLNSDNPESVKKTIGTSLVTATGEKKHFEQTIFPIEQPEGLWVASIFRDVTERENRLRQLKESEERFYKTFSLSPDGIVITTAKEGKILEANEAFYELAAGDRDTIEKITSSDLFADEDDREKMVMDVVKNGSVYDKVLRVKNLEGREFYASISSRLIEVGNEKCLISHIRETTKRHLEKTTLERNAEKLKSDIEERNLELEQINSDLKSEIAEREAIEQALKESEINYRKLIERLPIGVYQTMPNGDIVEANTALAKILGVADVEELKRMNAFDFYGEEKIRDELLGKLADADDIIRQELRLRRLDGREIYVVDAGRVKYDAKGVISGIDGIIEDVTERRKAAVELQKREKQYRSIFENIQDIYFRIDMRGIVRTVSPSTAKILGYDTIEIENTSATKYISDATSISEFTARLLKSGKIKNFEIKARRKDGKFVALSVNARIMLVDGKAYGIEGAARDITLEVSRKNIASVQHKLARSIYSAKDLPDLFASTHEYLKEIFEVKNIFFAIYDKKREQIDFPYYRDERDDKIPSISINDPIAFSAETIRQGKPQFLTDDDFRRRRKDRGRLFGAAPKVWMAAPLFVENECVGAIGIQDYDNANAFEPNDLETLELITEHIAAAIDRKKSLLAHDFQLKFLQNLIDTIPNPVYYQESEKRLFEGCNQAFEDFVGLKKKDIIGKSVFDLFPSEVALKLDTLDLEILFSGGVQNFEENMSRADGQVRNVVFYKSRYGDEHRKPSGIVGVIVDVTAYKNAQREMEIARERAETLYKVTPSCIFTVDMDRKITGWNERIEKLTGFKAEEMIGEKCGLCRLYRDEGKCLLLDMRIKKPIYGYETAIYTKNGEERIISKNIDLIRDTSGKIIGGIESFDDITEKKKIEEALFWEAGVNSAVAEISSALLGAESLSDLTEMILTHSTRLTDSETGFIAVYDTDKKSFVALARFLDGRRVEIEEIIDSDCDCFAELSKEDSPKEIDLTHENRSVKKLFPGKSSALLAQAKMQDETVGLIAVAGPVDSYGLKDSESLRRLASLFAVALRKIQADKEIRNALEKEQDLNELKSRFISMVSHEYRTPLTGISLAAEILKEYGDRMPPENKQVHFDRIAKSVKMLGSMIEDVIAFNKSDAGKTKYDPVEIDLAKFCLEIVKETKYLFDEKCSVDFEISNAQAQAFLDETALRQILTNLLSNAIKYSEKGSPVLFNVEVNDTIHIKIKDTGIGIPSEDLERIFDPFHRSENVGNIPGTGLGMSIVKKSVDAAGGSISVKSREGDGSEFNVILPLRMPAED